MIGYARVSTSEQSIQQQVAQLRAVGCDEIYTDQESGTNDKRKGLSEAIKSLAPNDTLVVTAFDRLGRNTKSLIEFSQRLDNLNVNLRSLREDIDTRTPMGRMFYSICATFAQFERDVISSRTKAGLELARKQGRVGGRKKAIDDKMRQTILEKLVGTSMSVNEIAAEHNISKSTIYKEFSGGRANLVLDDDK